MIKQIPINCRYVFYDKFKQPLIYKLKYNDNIDCPYCSTPNINDAVYAYSSVIVDRNEENILDKSYVLYECAKCKKVFMVIYGLYFDTEKPVLDSRLLYITPEKTYHVNLENEIQNLSPDFTQIYNEALNIEKLGYVESAGMIYRKSLEFLIKDFLIKVRFKDDNTKINSIKESALKSVIDTYFSNEPQLRCTSTLAAFIGNDFSHYEKRNNFNITEMKKYLDTFKYWILIQFNTSESQQILNTISNRSH